MNIDLNAIPTIFDIAHIGLAGLALLFFLMFLIKGGKKSHPTADGGQAKTEPKVAPKLKESTPDAALQLLSLLQQDARFIDFIREDLTGYSDADVGAAARVVHEGGQKVLNDYFTLAAVREEDEESSITLPEGFNASEVRLTGNVVGKPPFTGTLVHRGWKVTEIKLPKLAEGHDTKIVAPAEVEL
jgi:hypothetical protein